MLKISSHPSRIDGEDIRIMLWDTAGQEEFDAITKAYYRGAQACVLTFSTTDRASFEAVKEWKVKVENECGEIPTVIVQNKIDLMDQAVVSPWVEDLLLPYPLVRRFINVLFPVTRWKCWPATWAVASSGRRWRRTWTWAACSDTWPPSATSWWSSSTVPPYASLPWANRQLVRLVRRLPNPMERSSWGRPRRRPWKRPWWRSVEYFSGQGRYLGSQIGNNGTCLMVNYSIYSNTDYMYNYYCE